MTKKSTATMAGIKLIGLDLSKNSFQLHCVDAQGNLILRKELSRNKLAPFMAALPPVMVAMEACGGAHHWARSLRAFGHDVRLIAPQFVKPFVKSNKNDAADAEAISEAAQRPRMRFVPVKATEQQDVQSLHRVRSMAVAQRTAQVNQVRGLLLEYGIAIPKGRAHVRKALPGLLEEADNGLSGLFRELLHELYEELVRLDERIERLDRRLKSMAKEHAGCSALRSAPGIGPITATALWSAVGNASDFENGRHLAAWLGLVPRQHSTGGKPRLLGISKRGDKYLRSLLIHGARSVLRAAAKKDDPLSRWVLGIQARRGANIAAVALANKMARVAWALLSRDQRYEGAPAGV